MKKNTTLLVSILLTMITWQINAQNGGVDCSSAVIVTEGVILQTDIEDINGGHGNDAAWFVYTATENGSINVNSCGGGEDTNLFIWNDCADSSPAAANDDACSIFTGGGIPFASEISEFVVIAGQDYFIQWDNRWSSEPFDWSISYSNSPVCQAPNSFNASNIALTSVDFTWNDVPQATDGFTLSVFEAGANPTNDTAVFTEAIAEGVTNITVTGLMASTSYDAYLNSNCSDGLISNAITRHFSTLNVAPENDLCSEAINISCGSVTSGTTIGANPIGQGANLCNVTTGIHAPGVWYTFENTLPLGSEVTFSLCEGTNYDSQILIYSGNSCDGLTCVDSNDDACSFQSEITITTDESEQYYIYIFGFASSNGDFELSVTCNVPQPATCEPTENAFVTNETGTTVDMAWEEVPSAIDGYITYIVLQGDDPLVDPIVLESAVFPQSTTNMTATGLEPDVAYDAYIMSICDLENNITRLSQPFTFNTNLSTSTFETESFTMSPNLADGLVTFRANISLETLEVYNVIGQVVVTKTPNATNFTLDVSNLQSGTYFVKATAEGITTTQKLIKR